MAHSNIVGVRDFIPDAPAIVYAWMDGGTLDGALSNGPVAPSRAAEIACAVLSALGDAHRIGIIHRAVKPSNVLFDSAGAPRLSDFGAAHWSDATATATAGLFDALAYVSPEQREGRSTTPATDVFAVGALLHHMLTGRRPDGTARPSDTRPSLDTRHDAVLARLMSSDLAVRPGSAFEARSLILGLPWPSTVERPSDRAAIETPGAIREGSGRLEWKSGTWVDSWTGRAIERLAASDEARTRARGFAAAGHPALQTVLRIDRDGGELWLAALGGHPLHRALTPTERSRLGQALRLLHAAGVVHGRVASDHVLVGPGEGFVTLRFTAHAETDATPDRDLLDLDGL
jgi:serine/threonine-protein kinase